MYLDPKYLRGVLSFKMSRHRPFSEPSTGERKSALADFRKRGATTNPKQNFQAQT